MSEATTSRPRLFLLLAVAGSAALLVSARWRALTDASLLGYDESLFLIQGMAWTRGLIPARDTWTNKPPSLIGLFALSEWLFPGQAWAVRVLQALFLLGSCALVGWIAWRHFGRTSAGVAAAWANAVLTSTLLPPGDLLSGLSEPFFVLPLSGAIASLVLLGSAGTITRATWGAATSGLFIGIATQFRQNALMLLPFVLIALWFAPSAVRSRFKSGSALTAVALAGFGAAFVPVVAYYAYEHALPSLWYWCWTFPRGVEVLDPAALLLPGVQFLVEHAQRHWWLNLLLVPGFATLVCSLRPSRAIPDKRWRSMVLLGVLAFSAALCMLGGRAYAHYLVMLGPGVSLVIGGGVAAIADGLARTISSARPVIAGVLILTGVVLAVRSALITHERTVPTKWFGGEGLADAERGPLLRAIQALTSEDERIFIFGSCPGLYYRSRRVPAVPDASGEILFTKPLGPLTEMRVPASGGGMIQAIDVFARGMRTAALVIDATAVPEPRSALLSGQGNRWDHVGTATLADFPALRAILERDFTPVEQTYEGARLYLRSGVVR